MIRPVLWTSFVLMVLACAAPANALPVFAHRYGLSCQACHTAVPHLTAFGEAFRADGFRLAGVAPKPVFPVAVKVQLAYGSESAGGLPKAVVDEVEILAGGSLGTRGSYFAEQYAVDGGLPGRTRDLWATWSLTPPGAPLAVGLRAGQFTLDLPVDPESLRETTDHYAIFDQTTGDNPFAFFAPRAGVALELAGHDSSASFAALRGHDPASGLPSRGVDRHLYLEHDAGDLTLSAYRYDGARPVAGGDDRFWRQGYGLGWSAGRLRLDLVYQHGFDLRASDGGSLRSSGGFAQARYELSPRLFSIARYDGTQDTAFARALIAGLGYRPARNARLTVFDTVQRDVPSAARRNTFSTALLVAY